jgi:hypothetical protein
VEADVSSSWAQFTTEIGASTVTLAALVLVLMTLAHLSLRWARPVLQRPWKQLSRMRLSLCSR